MELAENKIVPEFEKIKGVSTIALMGLSQSSIVIHPDQAKLDKAQVPLQALMGVLQGQNFSTAIGEKFIDGKSTGITVIGNLDNLDALNNLTVAPNVKLKDIATVEATLNQESVTRVNGSPALVLVVTKDGSSNVTIGKEVADTAANVHKKFPNATSEVFYATSDMVVSSVNSMMKEVLWGALFATIVILLFLRNIRSTIITIVSIPLSLGLTLFLLSKSGVTLNF